MSTTKSNNLTLFPVVLRKLRRGRAITQGELGAAMGMTASAITNWEKGKTKPGHAELVRLADYFDVTTDELLGRTPLGVKTRILTDPGLGDIRRQLEEIVSSVRGFLEQVRRLEKKSSRSRKTRR